MRRSESFTRTEGSKVKPNYPSNKKIPDSHLNEAMQNFTSQPVPIHYHNSYFAVTTQEKVQALEVFPGHQKTKMVSVPKKQLIKRLKA